MAVSLPLFGWLGSNNYEYGAGNFSSPSIILPDQLILQGRSREKTKLTANSSVLSGSFITNGADGTYNGVRDIHISGGKTIDFFTDTFDAPQAAVANGISLDTQDGIVSNAKVSGFRGTCVRLAKTSGEVNTFETGALTVEHSDIVHGYIGLQTVLADSRIHGNMVCAHRDYCWQLTSAAANVQSSFNHFYGAGGAACKNESQALISYQDEFSDARYGYWGLTSGYNARLYGSTSIHCFSRHFLLETFNQYLENVYVDVWRLGNVWPTRIGVEIVSTGGDVFRWAICGSKIDTDYFANPSETDSSTACTSAIKINTGAHYGVIDDLRLHANPNITNKTGIHVAAPILGGKFDGIWLDGYTNTGDQALKIDLAAAACKGTEWDFYGPGTQSAKVFPSPPAGFDASNTVRFHNSTTGAITTLFP
jgi:hypothetical protein